MRLLKLLGIALLLAVVSTPADARKRVTVAHDDCNIVFPCIDVAPSKRGQAIVKAMGGLGVARPVYERRSEKTPVRANVQVVGHPPGCPGHAFCGCGAAVRVFGSPVRSLWLAAAWYKFPRTAPAPGMVAVRPPHVFVLEAHLGGNVWQVYDANSGGRQTRIHARSINGYTIVNPRA